MEGQNSKSKSSVGAKAQDRQPDQVFNKYRHRRRRWFWLALLAGFLLVAVPTAFAAAPTSPFYPLQRMGENLATNLAPAQKDFFRAVFAARRVREAQYVSDHLSKKSANQQAKDTKKISSLLQEYRRNFAQVTNNLGVKVDSNQKLPSGFFTKIENASAHLYLDLNDLRLEAPAGAQADVLQALETAQTNLAMLGDALKHPPISSGDAKALSGLVAAGLVTKDDLMKLISNVNSNRQLLDDIRTEVKNGTLPASALPALEYDLVAKDAPDQLAAFQAGVEFDEMRKIALLIKAITPTAAEKKQIQAVLANYVPGQAVDVTKAGAFVRPILYGLYLAQRLPQNMSHLDAEQLQPGRQLFYQTWKPLANLKTTDAKAVYTQAMALVDQHISRNADLLQQIEFEVLGALRANVVYMALPPGWTQEEVVAIQPAFNQLIADVRTADTLQQQTKVTTTSLVGMTTPLAATLANTNVEKLRAETKTSLAALQKKLTALSVGTTVPADTITSMTKSLSALKSTVTESLQSMTASNVPPNANLTQQISELSTSVGQSLAAANSAITDIQQQVTTNAAIVNALQQTVTDIMTASDATKADLERRLATLEIASGTTAALQKTVDEIATTSTKNVGAVKAQLADALKTQAELNVSLSTSIQTQADQAAELRAQLNLSDSTRQALKDEVASTITTVKTDQAAAVAKLEKTIADTSALQKQSTEAMTATISGITTSQAQMITSLQSQADSHDLLKSQVEASLAELTTASTTLTNDVNGLKPTVASLSTFVQTLKTDQDKALQDIQANATATATIRNDMAAALATIQASQTASVANITNGLESLGLEVRQSLTDVQQAEAATQAIVATLGTTVATAASDLATLKQTQVSASVTVQAHADALSGLESDLTQSVADLQQAQTQTQAALATVTADVSTLKQSVTDIQAAQTAAQAQINQLLAASVNWTQLPSSVSVTQAQLDAVKADLDAEFTTKSAALEAQYQQYHAQLNADITSLKTETDTQILRLRQEAADLKAQIQALQTTVNTNTTVAPATPGL